MSHHLLPAFDYRTCRSSVSWTFLQRQRNSFCPASRRLHVVHSCCSPKNIRRFYSTLYSTLYNPFSKTGRDPAVKSSSSSGKPENLSLARSPSRPAFPSYSRSVCLGLGKAGGSKMPSTPYPLCSTGTSRSPPSLTPFREAKTDGIHLLISCHASITFKSTRMLSPVFVDYSDGRLQQPDGYIQSYERSPW